MRRWLLLLLACICAAASAHEVPSDVRVQMFVAPEAKTLQVLVRVPMAAMREVDLPLLPGGFIDLPRADGALRDAAALWITDNLEVREGDRVLPAPRVEVARVSLFADRSFAAYDTALAQLRAAPIDSRELLYWKQQFLDVLLAYPIASAEEAFAIHPRFERMGLKVSTTLRYRPPGGTERAFELHGNPGLVHLDPGWTQAVRIFVELGFAHILDGTDHLLFLACLVIPFRRLKALIIIATAFTAAHSITLAAAALGYAPDALWFPPLVETLIAVSILYLALENIVGSDAGRRWMVAFGFGLVHGFGFAFGLAESLQFAGAHLATALFAFNLGVELGQVVVLLVLVPVLQLAFRFIPERIGIIVMSALVAHTAWHWMLERGEALRKFPWPTFDAAAAASLLCWILAAVALAALVWGIERWLRLGERLRRASAGTAS